MTKMTRMIFQEWFKSILDCREQLKCFEGTEASDRLVMPIAFIIKIFSGQRACRFRPWLGFYRRKMPKWLNNGPLLAP